MVLLIQSDYMRSNNNNNNNFVYCQFQPIIQFVEAKEANSHTKRDL